LGRSGCHRSSTGTIKRIIDYFNRFQHHKIKHFLQALQEDVKKLEPNVSNIKRVIDILSPKVEEELLKELKRIKERLDTTWVTVVAESLKKNNSLKNALELTQRTVEGTASIRSYLDELLPDIPAAAVINSTAELSQTLRKLNALKNRVDMKTNEYRSIVDAGKIFPFSIIYLKWVISPFFCIIFRQCGRSPFQCE